MNATKMFIHPMLYLRETKECEMKMENWMELFWTFDFVYQNEAIFYVKLEHTNIGLVTFFI